MIQRRRLRATSLVGGVALLLLMPACSGGGGGEQQPGQIGRIDGPATVDEDDAGADQDGAPEPVSPVGGAITDGS